MNGYQDLTTNIEHSRNSLRRIARNDDNEFSRESIVNLMEKFVKTVNVMDETILVPCRLMDRAVGDATDNVQVVPKHSHTHAHASGGGGGGGGGHGGHGSKRKGTSVHENLNQSELFNLYTMLNDVKVDLLWGRNSEEQPEETAAAAAAAAASLAAATASAAVDSVDSGNSSSSSSGFGSSAASIKSSSSTLQLSAAPATATAAAATATATQNAKGHVRRPSTVSVASSNSTATLSSDSDSDISNENDSGIESETKREVDKSSDLARQYRQHLLGLYRCLEQMTEAANYLTNRYQSDVGPV